MSAKPIRDLLEYLKIIHRGRFAERCADHLETAIREVESSSDDTAKATITISFAIQKVGEKIDMTANVASKLPPEKPFKSDTAWFVDGAISLQHPSQHDMFAGPRGLDERARAER